MKGKLDSQRNRQSTSSSSSSSDSSNSSNDHRRHSKYDDHDKYKSKRSTDLGKRNHRRSYSRSRSPESSPERDRKPKRDEKKQKVFKNDFFHTRIKEEPISDDDSRHRSKFSSSSRWPDNDSRRPGDKDRHWEKRPIKKERWRGESGNDKEPEWGKKSDRTEGEKGKRPLVDKAKPDFGLSGKLTEETNMYNGVVIKYSEPPEARKPKRRWRLYPFKGDEGLPTLFIHRQSAYLIGRDRKVADLPIDHPSCSKQHAALQYRLVPFKREDGMSGKRICPYIIDLESANGTFVNNKKIDAKKYVELMERDVIKFGFSSREYVLLHEHSKDGDMDDNV